MKNDVVRIIQVFDKVGDELVGEIPLSNVPGISQLREVFHAQRSDPMFDVYPIGPKEAKALAPCLEGAKLDLKRYDYFLACHAS
jgi:hypothetical protein